mmetsp:Transcript_85209/g.237889  ORF Transcript_85209/g.237889 Transcript_85209/m.237889 type:complete len:206 (+) Transcript_85209:430-1047(+)
MCLRWSPSSRLDSSVLESRLVPRHQVPCPGVRRGLGPLDGARSRRMPELPPVPRPLRRWPRWQRLRLVSGQGTIPASRHYFSANRRCPPFTPWMCGWPMPRPPCTSQTLNHGPKASRRSAVAAARELTRQPVPLQFRGRSARGRPGQTFRHPASCERPGLPSGRGHLPGRRGRCRRRHPQSRHQPLWPIAPCFRRHCRPSRMSSK